MTAEEYKNASMYWISRDKETKQADRETLMNSITEIISAHQNGVLGTCSDNIPRCTPVDYAYFDGSFYILSEGGLKFKGLAENKNVSFTIYNHDGKFGNIRSLQVDGTAEIVEPDSEEYIKNAEVRKFPISTLKKINMHLIKIVPKKIVVFDSELRKKDFSSRGTVEL